MADLRATRVTAFAGMALLSTTQDLVRATLPTLGDGVRPEVVAEETLALAATTTARAVEVGLRAENDLVTTVAAAVLEAPFLYHDLLLGAELIASGAEGDVEGDQSVYDRLQRKMEFYGVHFPVGRYPGPIVLRDKLPLWMGRISPPQLATTPGARLGDSEAEAIMSTHLRLVLAFAKKVAAG